MNKRGNSRDSLEAHASTQFSLAVVPAALRLNAKSDADASPTNVGRIIIRMLMRKMQKQGIDTAFSPSPD
jgi:hypothetical protein